MLLLVLWGFAGADGRRDDFEMRRDFVRPRVKEEERERFCMFLPLQNLEGRRLGTCCVFPGRHRRFFGETVPVRAARKVEHVGEQTEHENKTFPRVLFVFTISSFSLHFSLNTSLSRLSNMLCVHFANLKARIVRQDTLSHYTLFLLCKNRLQQRI